jgi:D-galactose 1-dehydrogenase
VRAELARQALDAGLSVLLEKPPTATLEEFSAIRRQAATAGLSVFTAWHSRFAPMVEPARAWLSGRIVTGGKVDWREDVRRWHPGQHWLWQPGGMGVFDPGINAFSILTAILPTPLGVTWAELDVPENRQTPIAVRAWLSMGSTAIGLTLDFLETQAQAWDIVLETACGHRLHLADGGATLAIDDGAPRHADSAEYRGVYARFAQLLDQGGSDADAAPMALALEALALGGVRRVAAFVE